MDSLFIFHVLFIVKLRPIEVGLPWLSTRTPEFGVAISVKLPEDRLTAFRAEVWFQFVWATSGAPA